MNLVKKYQVEGSGHFIGCCPSIYGAGGNMIVVRGHKDMAQKGEGE